VRPGGETGRSAQDSNLQIVTANTCGQDASLLADVVRQSIVFRCGGDLAACVRAVAADPDVAAVRVKNRLHPRHGDAAATAGYRDVRVSLRVATAEAAALGVAGHVCELQLLLLPFAEIKASPRTHHSAASAAAARARSLQLQRPRLPFAEKMPLPKAAAPQCEPAAVQPPPHARIEFGEPPLPPLPHAVWPTRTRAHTVRATRKRTVQPACS
jgi:hypothetical protein